MHKSEGRKKLTSWLCSLLETPAEFIKGLLSKNMLVTPRRSHEVSEHLPPALWFLKADAASGMWGIYEVHGAALGALSFCQCRIVG